MSARTADEERVPRKHDALPFVCVLEEEADAVLRVARRVQRGDLDAFTERKGRLVRWRRGDMGAVAAADYWDGVCLELVVGE